MAAYAAAALLGMLASAWGMKQDVISFRAPYSSGNVPGWVAMGSSVVTETFIRLTPSEAGHEGALWSQRKMPYREWELELTFKVVGARYLGGDGFAIWFTKQSEGFGGTFGNREDFQGVGVVLDTYDNDGKRDNPSIMAFSSTGDLRFDHDSDGREQKLPGAQCKLGFRNSRSPVMLRIRYQDKTLTVEHDIRGKASYTQCFKVGVEMPDEYFVGLSAHTGQVADNHDIYSLEVTSLEPATPHDDQQAPSPVAESPKQEKSEHFPHESAQEQHEWRRDDDRHLQRFADALQRWVDMPAVRKDEVRKLRVDSTKGSDVQDMKEVVDNELVDNVPEEAPASPESSSPAAEPSPAADSDLESSSSFKNEVKETLGLIQAEIRQIAHEMRGTITLAHAVSSQSGEETNAGGSARSASELLVDVGEIVMRSEKSVVKEMSLSSSGMKQHLDEVKRDLASLQAMVQNTLIKSSHDALAKVLNLQNDNQKILHLLSEIHQRRAGDVAGPREHPRDAHVDTLHEKRTSSGGVSYTIFLVSQIVWIGILIAVNSFGKKKDGMDFLPMSAKRSV
ncbi:hypothetical protein GUITHDRAFT_164025 [Guillardia theta CCMP2712]|uniref:L-type lectin-like domain-containing protein n=2 Tax=Guillardia theta TaxID=55529 RepID=L1J2S6_GUITC|nr:hypothetical protein GUITHDRAFT_164025 [Guillardia theta CCMP2712]EKX42796.1 hypothetical protein GUITHDRAFT_164025 [Guillardia theta CCMP2712]|eukprot:XP_005829776.1 hypothetical protein GUITHDRAFT_164025 [Guillardia theta CCMP2712]